MLAPVTISVLVILFLSAVCLGMGWIYFEAVQIQRPPIGVMNRNDVLWIFLLTILIPILYLALPMNVVIVIVVLAAISLAYVTLEPLFRSLVLRWIVVLTLISANLIATAILGVSHPVTMAINNLNFIITAIGIANLWAQA